MSKTLILLSGGMDSTAALYWARREHEIAGAVSFDYGSKHNQKEIAFAGWHCRQLGLPHDVVALPFVNDLFASDLLKSGGDIPDGHYADENMKRTVVPFRNGIMLAIACGIAESRGAGALVIAAHSGDHAIYPDCREPFMRAIAEAMREDYIRTARANGAGFSTLLWRHALKNAMLGATALIGAQVSFLLGGSVITEVIFAWPGLGRLLVTSVQTLDFPVVQAAVFMIAVFVYLAIMITDFVFLLIDPRLRRQRA